jgi:hypothetical protein
MLGFSLARTTYLNIGGSSSTSFKSGSSPGEWYWYRQGHYRIGITLHLAAIIPAGILMIWQFVPLIRHKYLLFHRVNGYIIIILVLFSNVGALMIARRAFGGTLPTQAATGFLVVMTTVATTLAYYNIKKLQIDQHRAWMLRAMFYLGTIITLRIILVIFAQIITAIGSYYCEMSCDEIIYLHRDNSSWAINSFYPACGTRNLTTDGYVVVHANFESDNDEEVRSSMIMSFGTAWWIAIFLHTVGVECYLRLTSRESERLRRISYEKQLKAGMKNPGSAGLTAERFGDTEEWQAPEVVLVGHHS